jgi:hypothetical protein
VEKAWVNSIEDKDGKTVIKGKVPPCVPSKLSWYLDDHAPRALTLFDKFCSGLMFKNITKGTTMYRGFSITVIDDKGRLYRNESYAKTNNNTDTP